MNLTAREKTFIENMGRQMAGWGLPRTTGRVYGYLLMRPDPAALDEIAQDLEVAKSGASVATRQLVSLGMARTHRQRGSKRLGFDAIYDLKGVLAAREAQMRLLMESLRDGAQMAAAPAVRRKMSTMSDEIAAVVTRLNTLAASPRKGRRA